MNGSDPLATLQRLQDKDLELDRIRQEQAQVPPDLFELRVSWQRLEAKLRELQAKLREAELEYRQNDAELADLKQKRSRAQESQRSSQSLREQTQYENLIQQLQNRIEQLDESNNPLLEDIQTLEQEIAHLEEELNEIQPRLNELEASNQARVERLEAELQVLWKERSELATLLPASLLKEYEAIRKARRGIGLARMIRVGTTYRCSACNVQLPTHVAQRVHQKSQLVHCPSCGRLLWIGSEQ